MITIIRAYIFQTTEHGVDKKNLRYMWALTSIFDELEHKHGYNRNQE